MGDLLERLARARSGQREAVFIRGEAGLGKSRLVTALLETARRTADALCGLGTCTEHVGPGLPYAPLFEVLEGLADRLGRERASALFQREAPTWLAQMPTLTDPADRATLETRVQGATPARMIGSGQR